MEIFTFNKEEMKSSINGNITSEFWKVKYYLEGNLLPNVVHWSSFWLVIFSSDSSSGLKCSFESVIVGCQQRRGAHLHELSTSWSALKILAA